MHRSRPPMYRGGLRTHRRRRTGDGEGRPQAAVQGLRRFGAASALPARGAVKSRGNPPWQSALTQSSQSAVPSRGVKSGGLGLNSTQNPSSRADSAIAAGRSLNGGAAPESTSWSSRDSKTDRYLP